MSKAANEAVIYRYLDRFPNGVSGTYRDLEEHLGIDHVTIRRIMLESNDISAESRGSGNTKETKFILKKYKEPVIIDMKPKNETKTYVETKPKKDMMSNKIETKDVKFNTRQHRLCDYLLDELKIHNEYIDKVDVLWDLKEHYVLPEDITSGRVTKDTLLKARHNASEYVKMTDDISFINAHGWVRQILIGSKGGPKGGIKALRKGEQYDAINKVLIAGLKKLKLFHAMRMGAELQANTRMVWQGEKELMDILREFDL